jgi:hypothetical protein
LLSSFKQVLQFFECIDDHLKNLSWIL